MVKRKLEPLAFLVAIAGIAPACPADPEPAGDTGSVQTQGTGEDTGPADAGTATEGSVGDTAGATSTTSGATSMGAGTNVAEGGVGGGGACSNDADLSIIELGEVLPAAQQCGTDCVGMDPQCAIDCVIEATGLTMTCAGCYATLIDCAIVNCPGPCAQPRSDECAVCQEEFGCPSGFMDCSGLESP